MKVFISWSGDRSKAIAELLRGWLPAVLQAVKPYYSPDDIAKGTRWSGEIAKELDASRVGLICLTSDNLAAPWIMFEAGALSKNLDRSRVCPLLFGVEPTDISGPLVQFQAAKFSRLEMERVVRMMNGELGDQALVANVLDSVFEMWWPKLEASISTELAKPQTSAPDSRSERDLLEEVLVLTRSMSRNVRDEFRPEVIADLEERFLLLTAALEIEGTNEKFKEAVMALARPIDHLCRTNARRHSTHVRRSMIRDEIKQRDLLEMRDMLSRKGLSKPEGDDGSE
ncbi:toll/interleukin-1 receptor domain-containing protein [Gemmatimonas aurantiaca]|uniref:toll/interleukin-1 receptor domain-containing protein n=1 Tax=Gemmatimonas aurantiaca TaxID=173480 RepID=UPI00301C71BF